jgi:cyclopropane fatty-acyl-phospholipid synthase-like methyltransferase
MTDDPARIVAAGYDRVAEEYARLEEGVEWPRLRRLQALLAQLEPGSDVLDVGCGNGVPALQEIAREHRAVGVDVSARQVELARANVPEARVLHADVRELDFAPASFDAIVSFYALDQIPREEHAAVLARWRAWLRPGGRLLLSVEDGDRPDAVGDWLGVPMFLSHFDAGTATRIAAETGFTIDSAETEEQLEGGSPVRYLWLLAHR